jgi:hypothetical protein
MNRGTITKEFLIPKKKIGAKKLKNLIFVSVIAALFLFPQDAANTVDNQPINYETAYKLIGYQIEI